MPTTSTGSLMAALRAGQKNRGVKALRVGFFAEDKYSNGIPVATVAIIQEYGSGNAPARPYMRPASKDTRRELVRLLAKSIDPKAGAVTPAIAAKFGKVAEDGIRKAIVGVQTPPNAPATILSKGSSNPLVGRRGKLVNAVKHEIEP